VGQGNIGAASQEGAQAAHGSHPGQVRRGLALTNPVPASFPRELRITRGAELRRLGDEGKRIRTKFLDVRYSPSPPLLAEVIERVRIGFIVPKLGHSAVERNRLKRRLRELARTQLSTIPARIDVRLRAKTAAYTASFAELSVDVRTVSEALAR